MAGYMKFDGVDGEAADKDHKGWTEIDSWSFGVSKATTHAATGTARQRADTNIHDILVTKHADKSSPKLFEHCCNGKVFKKVEVHMTASYTDKGRVPYLKIEMEDVAVTQFAQAGHADDVPSDNFTLNFEKIKVTYTENDEHGNKKGDVQAGWDVRAGKTA